MSFHCHQVDFRARQLLCWPIAMALICSIGCGDPNRKQLIGNWALQDSTRVEKRMNQPETDREESAASKMSIRFQSNGQLTTLTKIGDIDREKKGTWEFVSFDEDSKIMAIKCTLGMQITEHDIEFKTEDVIRLAPPNMAGVSLKLEFKRQ